ncbi:uncharacterized protein IWZ02DRAFT_452507, partial [Phyllosticta citriasiana]|uniref:uncharacterized protein n=1 Tax=Phyllosticta citriasiana TaxID=595635 RepID=UPI0030FD3527
MLLPDPNMTIKERPLRQRKLTIIQHLTIDIFSYHRSLLFLSLKFDPSKSTESGVFLGVSLRGTDEAKWRLTRRLSFFLSLTRHVILKHSLSLCSCHMQCSRASLRHQVHCVQVCLLSQSAMRRFHASATKPSEDQWNLYTHCSSAYSVEIKITKQASTSNTHAYHHHHHHHKSNTTPSSLNPAPHLRPKTRRTSSRPESTPMRSSASIRPRESRLLLRRVCSHSGQQGCCNCCGCACSSTNRGYRSGTRFVLRPR